MVDAAVYSWEWDRSLEFKSFFPGVGSNDITARSDEESAAE